MSRSLGMIFSLLFVFSALCPGWADGELPDTLVRHSGLTRAQYSGLLDRLLARQQEELELYRRQFVLPLPQLAERLRRFGREAGDHQGPARTLRQQAESFRRVLIGRQESFRTQIEELIRQYEDLLSRHAGLTRDRDSGQLLQEMRQQEGQDTLAVRLTDALEAPRRWEGLIRELDRTLEESLRDSGQ